jgi:hypothetical protein
MMKTMPRMHIPGYLQALVANNRFSPPTFGPCYSVRRTAIMRGPPAWITYQQSYSYLYDGAIMPLRLDASASPLFLESE